MHVLLAGLAFGGARILAAFGVVVAIFVPLERAFSARPQRVLRKGLLVDLGFYLLSAVVPKMLLVLPLSAAAWAAHRAVPSAYFAEAARLPGAVRLALALLVGEIGFYWAHRLMHEVPALWRFHSVHHRAEEMDFMVNTRAHPLDIAFGRLGSMAPLYFLGLAQPSGGKADLVPLAVVFAGGLWGFFVHANLRWRLGWLETVVATPAFHHWHHANDGDASVGKNYAAMLPFVDRLFSTHHLPARLPAKYGVDEEYRR